MKLKLIIKILSIAVAAVILLVALFIGYLTVTEYRPEARQRADISEIRAGSRLSLDSSLTVYSWNIGYAGLDSEADFFMDGGSKVNPSEEAVNRNLSEIKEFISSNKADAWLLQELDVSSARTGYINQLEAISELHGGSYALAYNYKCRFVPIPFPPIGRIASGIATFTSSEVTTDFERIALPCPFSWPVSTANLKRCLLITRLSIDGSDKEVVLVNLHLEAYDDGEGKLAQTKQLMEILEQEYKKGNYVIAGGDFNQVFPETLDKYPVDDGVWRPGILEKDSLPVGFSYAFDSSTPTCRLLNRPLDADSQMYVIDGFIVSPNVKVEQIETVGLEFANSDHNPVRLSVTLLK